MVADGSVNDPLRGYAVHFTRGLAHAPDARNPEQRRDGDGVPHTSLRDLLDALNALDTSGERASLSILYEGKVRPSNCTMNVAYSVAGAERSWRGACFSATSLDSLGALVRTRSLYGVGFTQDFIGTQGGGQVEYLPADSRRAHSLQLGVSRRKQEGVDPADGFWDETRFVDIVEPEGDQDRNTEWEEEWRVEGALYFEPQDVAFCFLPEELHEAARLFFVSQKEMNNGPAYLGHYLDPRWTRELIESVLSSPPPRVGAEERRRHTASPFRASRG